MQKQHKAWGYFGRVCKRRLFQILMVKFSVILYLKLYSEEVFRSLLILLRGMNWKFPPKSRAKTCSHFIDFPSLMLNCFFHVCFITISSEKISSHWTTWVETIHNFSSSFHQQFVECFRFGSRMTHIIFSSFQRYLQSQADEIKYLCFDGKKGFDDGKRIIKFFEFHISSFCDFQSKWKGLWKLSWLDSKFS